LGERSIAFTATILARTLAETSPLGKANPDAAARRIGAPPRIDSKPTPSYVSTVRKT
jgi:hypothetical protein